jgi:hypothetical protein
MNLQLASMELSPHASEEIWLCVVLHDFWIVDFGEYHEVTQIVTYPPGVDSCLANEVCSWCKVKNVL